jgi:hypothetical protein
MPGYRIVTAERWGMRCTYTLIAPDEEEAKRMVKDQEVETDTQLNFKRAVLLVSISPAMRGSIMPRGTSIVWVAMQLA